MHHMGRPVDAPEQVASKGRRAQVEGVARPGGDIEFPGWKIKRPVGQWQIRTRHPDC